MTPAPRTRMIALPGIGLGVEISFTVGGSLVEVSTRARCVFGNGSTRSIFIEISRGLPRQQWKGSVEERREQSIL